jgi:hypothetical protein
MMWIALAVAIGLLIFAWEREERATLRAELAERERDRLLAGLPYSEMLVLSSGARVEICAWPQALVARRESAGWN